MRNMCKFFSNYVITVNGLLFFLKRNNKITFEPRFKSKTNDYK